jgi:transcription antitermination factor NusB
MTTDRDPEPFPDASKVRRRTRARELALRALYLVDVRGDKEHARVPELFASGTDEPGVLQFAGRLFEGCLEHREELDARIAGVAENWQIHRMAVIDRNILRLGTYELMYLADIPPKVSINEAINLAKRYSTADSGAFVNGILDRIRQELPPQ